MTSRETAIARSVMYAALFDFPLTLEELRYALLESEQTTSEILQTFAASHALRAVVEYRSGFFFPRGRYALVAERRRRNARSRAFLATHARLLHIVSRLPFVRMVALSGSIAHLNLDDTGDLDLFMVTRGRHVWSTAVAVVLIAKLIGLRRTVCANFIISDTRLALAQQDLFTANQLIHLKPIVGEDVYVDFVNANPFIARFYPNFWSAFRARTVSRPASSLTRFTLVVESLLAAPSLLLEFLCRTAYRWYLRRSSATWRSPEQVVLQADCLKLHTRSHRRSVLDRFDVAVFQTIERVEDVEHGGAVRAAR